MAFERTPPASNDPPRGRLHSSRISTSLKPQWKCGVGCLSCLVEPLWSLSQQARPQRAPRTCEPRGQSGAEHSPSRTFGPHVLRWKGVEPNRDAPRGTPSGRECTKPCSIGTVAEIARTQHRALFEDVRTQYDQLSEPEGMVRIVDESLLRDVRFAAVLP